MVIGLNPEEFYTESEKIQHKSSSAFGKIVNPIDDIGFKLASLARRA